MHYAFVDSKNPNIEDLNYLVNGYSIIVNSENINWALYYYRENHDKNPRYIEDEVKALDGLKAFLLNALSNYNHNLKYHQFMVRKSKKLKLTFNVLNIYQILISEQTLLIGHIKMINNFKRILNSLINEKGKSNKLNSKTKSLLNTSLIYTNYTELLKKYLQLDISQD